MSSWWRPYKLLPVKRMASSGMLTYELMPDTPEEALEQARNLGCHVIPDRRGDFAAYQVEGGLHNCTGPTGRRRARTASTLQGRPRTCGTASQRM